ncbi:short chain dehydrogenase [Cystobasidium minutum MCA 4210]|uniref:short chain dehydrogenase n=1 Tax=Cystobasidium minutum MCA 4210 TaxID=1397322 RepID=UPI0034CD92EB|eukprot:jgi/Rhomi1/213323/estExt_Genemark1.C_110004
MHGKRILVTGGSAGLGAAVVKHLAARGAICAINFASDENRAKELVASLEGASKHVLVRGSMFEKQDAQEVVAKAIQQLGGLDGVVSNAGWTRFGQFDDLNSVSDEDWQLCYKRNVLSHLWVMQAARAELAQNHGSFVITASVAGLLPSGSSMAYAVSKAGAIHLTKSLAKACKPEITVNCVSPGVLKTDWSKSFSEAQLADTISANALGRLAELDDCAETILMLLQTKSVTGQNIEISAGYRL